MLFLLELTLLRITVENPTVKSSTPSTIAKPQETKCEQLHGISGQIPSGEQVKNKNKRKQEKENKVHLKEHKKRKSTRE